MLSQESMLLKGLIQLKKSKSIFDTLISSDRWHSQFDPPADGANPHSAATNRVQDRRRVGRSEEELVVGFALNSGRVKAAPLQEQEMLFQLDCAALFVETWSWKWEGAAVCLPVIITPLIYFLDCSGAAFTSLMVQKKNPQKNSKNDSHSVLW